GGGRARALALHPLLDVALPRAPDAHRTGWNVFRDHGARRSVGPVSDGYRSDQHRVATDPGVPTHDRAVLRDTVIVHHDGRGPEVGPLSDVGVSDVRQVRDLGALSHGGRLDLDEGAGLRSPFQPDARPQVGERPDVGLRSDLRPGGVRTYDARALTHLAVDQR